ncbi:MAG: hypothetical protein OXL68_04225 [Paracoccaceae bacterium]|nr:hypothetical protein [Paracoccaceae bacterium]
MCIRQRRRPFSRRRAGARGGAVPGDEARWRYEAVNPDNCLVADDLERLWNDRLQVVQACEERLSFAQTQSRRQDQFPEDQAAWLSTECRS